MAKPKFAVPFRKSDFGAGSVSVSPDGVWISDGYWLVRVEDADPAYTSRECIKARGDQYQTLGDSAVSNVLEGAGLGSGQTRYLRTSVLIDSGHKGIPAARIYRSEDGLTMAVNERYLRILGEPDSLWSKRVSEDNPGFALLACVDSSAPTGPGDVTGVVMPCTIEQPDWLWTGQIEIAVA